MNDNHKNILTKPDQIEKFFKLSSNINTSNMVLFNAENKITKFESIAGILDEYFDTRLNGYQARKDYLLSKLMREIEIL